MNGVNVGVEVPQTSQNATSSSSSGRSQTQTAGETITPIIHPTLSNAKVSPQEDAGLAIFAIIFILIAVILLILVFRNQLLKLLKK